VLLLVVLVYLIAPFFYSKADFLTKAYDLILSTSAIFWFLSTIFLFLDLPVLLWRYRRLIQQGSWRLLLPTWLLYSSCAIGLLATLISIFISFTVPIDTLFTPEAWQVAISIAVLVVFLLGFMSAAYPRLLSSVKEQTVVARENARLYAELREAYEKLYQLDQHKDAFLSIASHELRTPLTIVQGYVELLGETDEGKLDPETRTIFIRRVRQACDELTLLLANIMDASHLQQDTLSINSTHLRVRPAAMFVIELFDPIIIKQQREIQLDISGDLMVWADEVRLKQILRNLLANALHYTPATTPILITGQMDEVQSMVTISVIDHGPGIPLDKQEVIFDKFVRLERDMHGDSRGSGLGLAICRELVGAMHGSLSVKSSGIEGEETVFSFTLPGRP
jgi:signal transduction histidine kinase